MANNGGATGAQWIKSDEIRIDTSKAPWMEFAKAELNKKVHELQAKEGFSQSLRRSIEFDSQMRSFEAQAKNFQYTSALFGNLGNSGAASRYHLGAKPANLGNPVPKMLGNMEAQELRRANPEINKYFDGLKTDPHYNKKGKSYDIASTHESGGRGRITAWCAAFVNWCLRQADAPHLGVATARSWLDFGTPVAHPVYGCVTIIKPSSSTGSTTGHVAFYVKNQGHNVMLLGGNQGDWVSEAPFKEKNVLGYRWPTAFNHYLLARGVLV